MKKNTWHLVTDEVIQEINTSEHYAVKTNGGEWRDTDMLLWKGIYVIHRLNPQIVRGRPIYIMELSDPMAKKPYEKPTLRKLPVLGANDGA